MALRIAPCLVHTMAVACREGSTHGGPPPAASARTAAGAPSSSAALLEMAPALLRAMKLAPRLHSSQKIAFFAGGLTVVERDAVSVRHVGHFESVQRLSVPGAEKVQRLADGSVVALAVSSLYRLRRGEKDLERYARPTFFPESLLLAGTASATRLWVLHPFGTTLYGYDLAATAGTLLAPKKWVELAGHDHAAFTTLADGSFLYTAGTRFVHLFESGRAAPAQGTVDGVCRLLAAHPANRAWLVRNDGRVELVEIGSKMRRVALIQVDATPFDAAADGGDLALLSIRQPKDAPKSWQLDVFDKSGERRFSTSFEAEQSTAPDWLETLTFNAHLALSEKPPLVAVGGPNRLSVWDARSGARVFTAP